MKRTTSKPAARWIIAILAGAFCVLALAPMALGKASDRGVLPVNSSPYGLTYAEWSAAHWQWLFSLPMDQHPLNDTADVSEGQTGQVWFLGGTFSSSELEPGVYLSEVTRDCEIPRGKALFFPLVDVEASIIEEMGGNEEELRAVANWLADLIVPESLFCEVDGTAVQNLADFRVESPLFTIGPLPENNVIESWGYEAPPGTTSQAVSDGYFVMLAPLPVGTHTLHFGGTLDASAELGFIFMLDITYNTTVVAK